MARSSPSRLGASLSGVVAPAWIEASGTPSFQLVCLAPFRVFSGPELMLYCKHVRKKFPSGRFSWLVSSSTSWVDRVSLFSLTRWGSLNFPVPKYPNAKATRSWNPLRLFTQEEASPRGTPRHVDACLFQRTELEGLSTNSNFFR